MSKATKFKPVNVERTWRRVGGNIVVGCVRGDDGGEISISRGKMDGFITHETYPYSDELWAETLARYEPLPTGIVTASNQMCVYIAQHPDGDVETILESPRTEQATFDAARAEAVATHTPRVAVIVREVGQ